MSSIANKYQEQQQAEQQVTSKQTVVVRKVKIHFGEVVLLCVMAIALTYAAVNIVTNQATIYKTNKEIQMTETVISDQTRLNNDLKEQVGELSRYERIWEKAAELGLMLNENNVKVVQD